MHILDSIVAKTREVVRGRKSEMSLIEMRAAADQAIHTPRSLTAKLALGKPLVIAEFKRKSPSKPHINPLADPAAMAGAYQAGGAAAMSVLTEPHYFAGSMGDLAAVRQRVDLPLLRKDFMIDEYQFYEARQAGADVVLLIARILDRERLHSFCLLAQELGMEVLCEIHHPEELTTVADAPIDFLGLNCRDLTRFTTRIDRLIDLVGDLPEHVPKVAESGIHSREDLWRLYRAGYAYFLIGEYLMTGGEPERRLRGLVAS